MLKIMESSVKADISALRCSLHGHHAGIAVAGAHIPAGAFGATRYGGGGDGTRGGGGCGGQGGGGGGGWQGGGGGGGGQGGIEDDKTDKDGENDYIGRESPRPGTTVLGHNVALERLLNTQVVCV